MDRREFLLSMRGSVSAGDTASHREPAPVANLRQQPLPFSNVKLTNGLLADRFALNSKRTFSIPPDDILYPFFRAKGITGRGKEMNDGYAARVQTGIWPGLYSCFWMSGAAHIARWSGDPSQAETLRRMVHDLAETKEPDGYLLAMDRASNERWAHRDLYALIRSMCRCTMDIYELTGDPVALELARGQMDCVYNDLEAHTGPGGGIVLKNTRKSAAPPVVSHSTGPYKLLPALSQLFQHTRDERYSELADMCIDMALIQALVEGSKEDPLVGLHASTWADFFTGIYQLGLANGNQRYVEAALKAWEIVRTRHMYITGGSDSGEFWQSGDDGWQLRETTHAEETACASLWLAFEQNLLHGTGDLVHADYIERVTFNHLFSSQNPETGDFCYFLDLQGRDKPYDAAPAYGRHCCDGNGLRAVGRLGGLIYGKTADGIAVNLYTGSEAVCDGVRIIQETDYPASGTVLIRVEPHEPRQFVLSYRLPGWCKRGARASVNHEPVEANGRVARQWKSGDQVRLEFPMQQTPVHDTRIGSVRMALKRGPVVYAATWSDGLPVRMSGDMPDCGVHSTVDVWPYLPTVLASSIGDFEAQALLPAVPEAPPTPGQRVKVQYVPFHSVTRGKYSVWLPVVQA